MDAGLTEKIVREVVATLRKQGLVAAGAEGRHPRATGVMPVTRPAAPEESRPARKVFLTAGMLRQRIGSFDDGRTVQLACDEFLTPSAQDLAHKMNLAVSRTDKRIARLESLTINDANAPSGGGPTVTGPDRSAPRLTESGAPADSVGLIVERPDAKVTGLIGALSYDGLNVIEYGRTGCWLDNLQSLCDAVASGAAGIGVAILPYAANAMLLAGKTRGVRPVQATRAASISAAIRHFDANVLIVEHSFCTYHELRMMIRAFVLGRPAGGGNQALLERLARIEG